MVDYNNPRMKAEIPDWPMGGSRRGTAVFEIQQTIRGERGTRHTVSDTGHVSAVKVLTYADKARIVDGSDGKTYVACLTRYGNISVFRSNLQSEVDWISAIYSDHAKMLALFQ